MWTPASDASAEGTSGRTTGPDFDLDAGSAANSFLDPQQTITVAAVNKTKRSPEVRFLNGPNGDIEAHLVSLERADRLAVDTESDSFHRYFEKVCLIQVSTETEDFVYDPLIDGLSPRFRSILDGGTRELVLHGADNDVRALKQSFGLALGPLFDTLSAAQILGLPNIGLKALLESELGIVVDKGEQRSDWARRPLSAQQLAYARQDTADLLALRDLLEARLRTAGRLSWHEEECRALREREPTTKTFRADGWQQIKGASTLDSKAKALLEALYVWRDEEARKADRPAFRIVNNEPLLRMAKAIGSMESTAFHRAELLGMLPRNLDRRSLWTALEPVVEQIKSGAPLKPSSNGKTTRTLEDRPDPETRRLTSELRAARDRAAKSLGVDPGFLISSRHLERIAKTRPNDLDALSRETGLSAWRLELLGAQLISVCGAS
jgi:ribonuclease D